MVRDVEGDLEPLAVRSEPEAFVIFFVHAHVVEDLVGFVDVVLVRVRELGDRGELAEVEGVNDLLTIYGEAERLPEAEVPDHLAPVVVLVSHVQEYGGWEGVSLGDGELALAPVGLLLYERELPHGGPL